jgi:Mn-dependent DtxR family transcriptional regulator
MKSATRRKLYLAISECDFHFFKAVEIASSLGVSRACACAELKVLLEEGILFEKEGKRLSLTPQGEQEVRKAVEEYERLASAIRNGFNYSQSESRHFARSLLEGTY